MLSPLVESSFYPLLTGNIPHVKYYLSLSPVIPEVF